VIALFGLLVAVPVIIAVEHAVTRLTAAPGAGLQSALPKRAPHNSRAVSGLRTS
jgi:hypothetical protein